MDDELTLEEALAAFVVDPVSWVYFSFPWGSGELEKSAGPEPWQIEVLTQLGQGLITLAEAVQIARTSGHGIGKSALVAWIILWALSTFEDTKGVVTANTETQLKTKTWAEVAKWHRLFIGKTLFKLTATALFSVDPDHEKTWRFDMVPWSEKNTEAFAGLHNQGKRVVVIFDEASAIADVIWETTEGALTDLNTQIIWLAFGNPTRNKGRFRECFPGGKFAHRWNSAAIDSRTVSFTDKTQIAKWAEDWGEDSDFFRIRVRGVFPRIDSISFISFDAVVVATRRTLPEVRPSTPIILGVDVGRFGSDPSAIYPRRGLDARSIPPVILQGADTMTTAKRTAAMALQLNAALICIDAGAIGGGVADRLRELRIRGVIDVDFGQKPDGTNGDGVLYANKRAEMWGGLKNSITDGLCLPEGFIANITPDGQKITLEDELIGPSYEVRDTSNAILLEGKREMKRRGVPSPNLADALALTFAMPVYEPPANEIEAFLERNRPVITASDYDPYSRERIFS